MKQGQNAQTFRRKPDGRVKGQMSQTTIKSNPYRFIPANRAAVFGPVPNIKLSCSQNEIPILISFKTLWEKKKKSQSDIHKHYIKHSHSSQNSTNIYRSPTDLNSLLIHPSIHPWQAPCSRWGVQVPSVSAGLQRTVCRMSSQDLIALQKLLTRQRRRLLTWMTESRSLVWQTVNQGSQTWDKQTWKSRFRFVLIFLKSR